LVWRSSSLGPFCVGVFISEAFLAWRSLSLGSSNLHSRVSRKPSCSKVASPLVHSPTPLILAGAPDRVLKHTWCSQHSRSSGSRCLD
jgi:hypothetical protein